jgi:dephospho-CoA kinase
MSKKIILGLTGSFGSGKSTVAKMFACLGAKVIDADKIGHKLFSPRGGVYKKIIKAFGKGIISSSGAIDRQRLGKKVFSEKSALRKINSITHPEIIKAIKKDIIRYRGLVVLDAPLLIEAGLLSLVDKLVVVKTNKLIQLKRISARDNLSKGEIEKIIRSQAPLKSKERLADFVIDNNGSIEETEKQVKQLIRRM